MCSRPGFSFAAGQTPGLEHTAYFTPPQASYCNGTHVAEVEVDPFTGGVKIVRYTVAHDSGTIPAPTAIISAVEDALSPFGVRFAEMPLTPDRIVDALRKAGAYETLSAA